MARGKAVATNQASDSENESQSSGEDELQPTSAQPAQEPTEPPKKRGRPPKDKTKAGNAAVKPNTGEKRGRGRPRKSEAAPEPASEETAPPAKRGRGRPPKNATATSASKFTPTTDPPKKSSRPTKNPFVVADDIENEEEVDESEEEAPPPKKRGRPPKAPVKRGRGRPPKSKTQQPDDTEPEVENSPPRVRPPKNPKPKINETGEKLTKKRKAQDDSDHVDEPPPKRGGAGRPKKAAATGKGASAAKTNLKASNDDMTDANGRRYWLMKAEPESRLEKGVDVKYSIEDLKAAKEPDAWDGVRNYQARNNMAGMRKGELAFFYHSNCKTPGIAGIMEIVEESTPDESAFDPDHPYYDPKSSRDQPKWLCVHVAFKKEFKELVTLHTIKADANSGGPLANMQLVKGARLSVSKVSPAEWEYILSLAGEGVDDDDTAADNGEDEEMEDPKSGSPSVVVVPPAWTNAATNTIGEEELTEKLEEAKALKVPLPDGSDT